MLWLLMSSLHTTVAITSSENYPHVTHDSKCGNNLSSTTVTSWVLSVVLVWTVIYRLYWKVVSVFLRRMTLPLIYRIRLTESLWNAGFCISCIPLCITKLLVHVDRVTDIINIVTVNVFVTEKAVAVDVLFTSIVICAYYVHSIYLTYAKKGLDVEFFARGLLLLFLYTCYCLRYIWAGLSAIILISTCTVNVEFVRICYSLNQNKMMKSRFMQNVTCLLFVFHCMLWAVVFLYILPQCYLLPAVNIRTSDQNILALTVLCATLWSYFGLQIFCAPVVKVIRYCVWPDDSSGHRDWLNCALFQPCSEEVLQLKARMEQAHSAQYDYFKKEKLQSGVKRSGNSMVLYQTIRCVMAMKRRIRRKRAAQALASSSSELEVTNNHTVQGNT